MWFAVGVQALARSRQGGGVRAVAEHDALIAGEAHPTIEVAGAENRAIAPAAQAAQGHRWSCVHFTGNANALRSRDGNPTLACAALTLPPGASRTGRPNGGPRGWRMHPGAYAPGSPFFALGSGLILGGGGALWGLACVAWEACIVEVEAALGASGRSLRTSCESASATGAMRCGVSRTIVSQRSTTSACLRKSPPTRGSWPKPDGR